MSMNEHDFTPHRQRTTGMDVERAPQASQNKAIKAKEVARKIKSFDHFAYIWGEKAGFYLPPKKSITWHFISQILADEKKLVKMASVGNPIELPKVKGLFVQDLFWKYKDVKDLDKYFPDVSEGHRVPRNYFFNVC